MSHAAEVLVLQAPDPDTAPSYPSAPLSAPASPMHASPMAPATHTFLQGQHQPPQCEAAPWGFALLPARQHKHQHQRLYSPRHWSALRTRTWAAVPGPEPLHAETSSAHHAASTGAALAGGGVRGTPEHSYRRRAALEARPASASAAYLSRRLEEFVEGPGVLMGGMRRPYNPSNNSAGVGSCIGEEGGHSGLEGARIGKLCHSRG